MGLYTSIFTGLNLLSCVIMGYDKVMAKSGMSRVPEKVLLLLGLFGGIGIVVGALFFNHKHSKLKFRIIMPIELMINVFIAIRFLQGGTI